MNYVAMAERVIGYDYMFLITIKAPIEAYVDVEPIVSIVGWPGHEEVNTDFKDKLLATEADDLIYILEDQLCNMLANNIKLPPGNYNLRMDTGWTKDEKVEHIKEFLNSYGETQ